MYDDEGNQRLTRIEAVNCKKYIEAQDDLDPLDKVMLIEELWSLYGAH